MIFVATGTQKFQFNRLLAKIDELISKNKINEELFAQIGHSTYIPKNYSYKRFMSKEEYEKYMDLASVVISHGGVGTILEARNKGKAVVVVPRLSQYDEHVDNHQMDITKKFSKEKIILMCERESLEDLPKKIEYAKKFKFKSYKKNNEKFVRSFERILMSF